VSGSIRRTSTEGSGKPTAPSMRAEKGNEQDNAIPTSVMPYRSSNTFPEESSVHADFVGVGSAAEPEMLSRRCLGEIACFDALWISDGNVGKVDSKRV